QYANSIISTEQYLDYIMNRAFRKTLICHKDIKLNRTLDPAKVKDFYFTSTFRPDMQNDDTNKNEMAFKSLNNSRLIAKDPVSISVWLHLKECYPEPMDLSRIKNDIQTQLKQSGSKSIPDSKLEDHILGNLLLGYSIGG